MRGIGRALPNGFWGWRERADVDRFVGSKGRREQGHLSAVVGAGFVKLRVCEEQEIVKEARVSIEDGGHVVERELQE
jgi:hypothetical protein